MDNIDFTAVIKLIAPGGFFLYKKKIRNVRFLHKKLKISPQNANQIIKVLEDLGIYYPKSI